MRLLDHPGTSICEVLEVLYTVEEVPTGVLQNGELGQVQSEVVKQLRDIHKDGLVQKTDEDKDGLTLRDIRSKRSPEIKRLP